MEPYFDSWRGVGFGDLQLRQVAWDPCRTTWCSRPFWKNALPQILHYFDGTKHIYSYMIPSIHFKSPANFKGIQVLRLPAMVVFVFKWYIFLARKTMGCARKFLNTLRCEPLRGSRAYDFFLRQKHGLQRRWNPFMSLKSGWRRIVVILNPSFLIQPGSLNYPFFGDQTVRMYGNLQELPLIVCCLGW